MHLEFELEKSYILKLQTFQTQKFFRLWLKQDFLEDLAIGRVRGRMIGVWLAELGERHSAGGHHLCLTDTPFWVVLCNWHKLNKE